MMDRTFWSGKTVFVTGHTGFKGGWLTTWLLHLGSRVFGYALQPEAEPSYFTLCGLERRMHSVLGDVRDSDSLTATLQQAQPDVIFHLAAQPLVRRSYRQPVETFATNVMGTVHLLEAVRQVPSVRAVIIVTSDKCYENREWLWGYREEEPMGGHDPYSASKGCAELVTAAYRRSFFANADSQVSVASVRAGNVIGGGDWAEDRLVPDAITVLQRGEPLMVRHPEAVRPWQHVLEPLKGYLMLAERLHNEGERWAGAWNFGPRDEDAVTVAALADMLIRRWGEGRWQPASGATGPHEAHYLKLDTSKARHRLGWHPCLTLEDVVTMTVEWYRKAIARASEQAMYALTCAQIQSYEARAHEHSSS